MDMYKVYTGQRKLFTSNSILNKDLSIEHDGDGI